MRKENIKYIEEEITMAEFCERFMHISDYNHYEEYDISDLDIEIESQDDNGEACFQPLTHMVFKGKVPYHYTDGKIKVSEDHRFIENGVEIKAKDHPDFYKVDEEIFIVDPSVANTHCYIANGRLNHNTTSGGKAIGYHSSVRVRLKPVGKIRTTDKDIVGIETEAVIFKNRISAPWRSANFNIYYESGIDNYASLFDSAVKLDIIKSGAWNILFNPETGEEITKFRRNDFESVLKQNPEIERMIVEAIQEKQSFKYKNRNIEDEELAKLASENDLDEEIPD